MKNNVTVSCFSFLWMASLFATISARADIVGGAEVKSSADPARKSIAALYEPSATGHGGALCTASLIGPNTAVTAAHCVDPNGPKPVMIFGNDVRSPLAEKRPVTAVSINPKWKTHQGIGMDQGDIAVIKFGQGIPDGYQPISMMQDDSSLKKGEPTTLAGYGISNPNTKVGAGVLRKTQVKIDNPRAGKTEMILDQSRGHGACHGDSGGPAYVRQGGKVVLAGVTNRSYPSSAPDDCGHKVVYTKVGAYEPWIKKTQQRYERGMPQDVASNSVNDPAPDYSARAPKSIASSTMKSIKGRTRHRLPVGERQMVRLSRSAGVIPKRSTHSVSVKHIAKNHRHLRHRKKAA